MEPRPAAAATDVKEESARPQAQMVDKAVGLTDRRITVRAHIGADRCALRDKCGVHQGSTIPLTEPLLGIPPPGHASLTVFCICCACSRSWLATFSRMLSTLYSSCPMV